MSWKKKKALNTGLWATAHVPDTEGKVSWLLALLSLSKKGERWRGEHGTSFKGTTQKGLRSLSLVCMGHNLVPQVQGRLKNVVLVEHSWIHFKSGVLQGKEEEEKHRERWPESLPLQLCGRSYDCVVTGAVASTFWSWGETVLIHWGWSTSQR